MSPAEFSEAGSGGRRPVALVTGGRRGIGAGIARTLAAKGFDLAITGTGPLDPETDALVGEIAAEGVACLYVPLDLAELDGHGASLDRILERFGAVDCLVNNAGMASVVRGDFLALEPRNFDTIIGVNLRGTVFFTQAVVRTMLAAGRGPVPRSVINVTSVSAELSSPERLDYCMTKAALAAFSQGLTLRLAESGIAVFELRPGIVRSDMTAKVAARYDGLIAGGLVPVCRWGEPEDVGKVVAALAAGEFAFATGSIINVDGGLSIARL